MTQNEMERRIQELEAQVVELHRMLANFPVRIGAGGGGGDGLPEGGRKFDVLMRLDDALTPGWERPRWHE